MARLDTGWHANAKVIALPWQGIALHAWSISYCDAQLTDGFIPEGAWWSKRGVLVGVKALVAAGLWEPTEGGYELHDYTDYNRTKAQVIAQREEDRVRKESGRTNGRNPAGQTPESGVESGRIPRAPGPGPVNSGRKLKESAAAAAPSGATPARTRVRVRAHKPTLSPELQAEHERYLARERAAAAAAGANSISSNGGRRG